MAWFSSPGRSSSPRRSSAYPQRPSNDSKGYYYRTSSSHSSRARPRGGYVNRILSQIKRYLRHLYDYARDHPVKLIMLLLPLLTGGALAGVLAKFGIRLPAGLASMVPGGAGGKQGFGGRSDVGGGAGVQGLMKMAQMFV
ncbi:hypothetical protein HO133_008716 [Letharia lupina]|uniref:Uncharacterized protein n=1 Tax=Letharia lupina TaxID=560253 RepID=A0A8H6CPQ2_9LECA|nr:uncharacterized protein HO133_008716 [Letharia lupina]KAF6227273.1 hypothetical protein HO133_008716 [Letharia lupina]